MAVTPGTFQIFGRSEVIGKVKFTGGNDIGPQIIMELPRVMFRPANAIGLISDEWGQLTLTGEVLADDTGVFGTMTHPDTGMVAPVTDAYYIGKGVIEVQIDPDDLAYRALGNVPTFEFTPNITTLPHFSSMVGVRTKDLEVITEKSASLNIVMEEFTYQNLMLVLLGEPAP